MRRVLVIGSGGAGKSTFAAELGRRTGLPVIHLDQHYWGPGWAEPPKPEWQRHIDALISGETWILDGNYGGTLDRRLAACDTVIFLDMPRTVCLWRVLRRRWSARNGGRTDMAAGCPERLTWDFIRWIWTYPRVRRPGILERLRALELDQKTVVLTSTADANRWLAAMS